MDKTKSFKKLKCLSNQIMQNQSTKSVCTKMQEKVVQLIFISCDLCEVCKL